MLARTQTRVWGPHAPWLLLGMTGATAFGVGAALLPLVTVWVAGLVAFASGVVAARRHVEASWGRFLAVTLFGYAVGSRGVAYLGIPPLYLGEIVLALGLLSAVVMWWVRRAARHEGQAVPLHPPWPTVTRVLFVLLSSLMAWGAIRTVPFLGRYGLDALRDGALWGYALFAFLVTWFIQRWEAVRSLVSAYRRLVPWALAAMLASMIVATTAPNLLPTWPWAPDVPILDPKFGDVAVHAAGAFVVLALDLGKATPSHAGHTLTALAQRAWHGGAPWLLALLWLATWTSTFGARAAVVTVLLPAGMLVLLQPRSSWWRPAYLAVLLALAAGMTGLRYEAPNGREVSAASVTTAVTSITGEVGSSGYDGTRAWRLAWWADIGEYTLLGPYRWTGKGFGPNLADQDGYQVLMDGSLRSPHNVTMTFLARTGVPGAVLWTAFVVVLLGALVTRWHVLRREGFEADADLVLAVALYITAFLVNGSLDVYLEGPQGGIWFWCLVGVALAALRDGGRKIAS